MPQMKLVLSGSPSKGLDIRPYGEKWCMTALATPPQICAAATSAWASRRRTPR